MSNLLVGGSASLFLIIIGVFIFLQFVPVGLWISAISAGVSISIFNLVGMRLRRVPPQGEQSGSECKFRSAGSPLSGRRQRGPGYRCPDCGTPGGY